MLQSPRKSHQFHWFMHISHAFCAFCRWWCCFGTYSGMWLLAGITTCTMKPLGLGKHPKMRLVFRACLFLETFLYCNAGVKHKNPSNLCELQTQANRRLQPMQSRVSHYQSCRPVSTSWAPTGTAGAPPPGGYSNLLTASCLFLQFRHLSADFTVSAHESWFADTSSQRVTLQWHGS